MKSEKKNQLKKLKTKHQQNVVKLSILCKQNQTDSNYLIGDSRNAADLSFFYRKKDIKTIHIFLERTKSKIIIIDSR